MKTKVLVLIGKSGSGKDTISKLLPYNKVVRYTTRPKRDNETEGVDYNFLESIPSDWIMNDEWLELVKYNDWVYLTRIDSLKEGEINIICTDPQSADQIYMSCLDLGYEFICFNLIVPDKIRLQRQLSREENPNCHEICRRYLAEEKEYDLDSLSFKPFPLLNVNIEKTINFIKSFMKEKKEC